MAIRWVRVIDGTNTGIVPIDPANVMRVMEMAGAGSVVEIEVLTGDGGHGYTMQGTLAQVIASLEAGGDTVLG